MMIRQDPSLQFLGAARLRLDLVLQTFGNSGHLRQCKVVLRHFVAELLPSRFHQGFGIAFFQPADKESQKSPEQPAQTAHRCHNLLKSSDIRENEKHFRIVPPITGIAFANR